MNKKGQLGAILGLVLFILILMGGALVLGIGTGVVTYTSRTINDVTSTLGVVDLGGDTATNLSSISDMTIGTVNSTIQMAKWGSGFLIVFALLGVLLFAYGIKERPYLIGFYFLLVIILIICSIFVSNMYEAFYNGTDDIATELHSMVITSFLILYMPHIITLISFIGGIIMFSGVGDEFQ